MSDIKIVYQKLFSPDHPLSSKSYIEIYEENKSIIENDDWSLANQDYDLIMRIVLEYSLALSQYGSSKKSIPYLDKSIDLFENSIIDDLTRIPAYETLVWTRGVERYNQKHYSLANEDFKYLVNHYPENDKYKNWLSASKLPRSKIYLNLFWYCAIICMIIETFLKNQNLNSSWYFLLAYSVFFILAIAMEIRNYVARTRITKK